MKQEFNKCVFALPKKGLNCCVQKELALGGRLIIRDQEKNICTDCAYFREFKKEK